MRCGDLPKTPQKITARLDKKDDTGNATVLRDDLERYGSRRLILVCVEREARYWMSPILGAVQVAAGNVAIFTSTLLYLVDTYESTLSASALPANGIMRYIVGALDPLSTLQMYEHLHIDWATSLLGFTALAM